MTHKSAWFLGGVLAVGLASAGCSRSGTVSGKVSYKGETLGGGSVLFFSPGQKSVSATIGPDGSYTIAGIPSGEVKIAVETKSAQPTNEEGMARRGQPPKDAVPPGAESPLYKSAGNKGKYVEIPDYLADPEKSELTLKVTGGDQHHDIEIP
jgi:hypothetical protein